MMDWYIAELASGATRVMAPSAPWARGKKEVAWSRAPRPNETAVEYALAEAGFATYLPRMRKEIIHHRTHKTIVRAFPLFTGYAFIGADPSRPRFRDMLDAKGVLRLLGAEGRPVPLSQEQIDLFRNAEEDMTFDDTREARIRRKQEGRNQAETLRMRFPAGSRATVTLGPFAGFSGQVVDVIGKGLVRAMVEIFGRATPVEFEPDFLKRVA